jgi:inward rectifier potassium channel
VRKVLQTPSPQPDYQIQVVGAGHGSWRDAYHAVLRWPWSLTLALIATTYLAANAVFALAYFATGGVANMPPGSLKDAFFFSVQTMGTIGYGVLYPKSDAANVLVVAESIIGLLLTALSAGLVFAKFSRSSAHLMFSREAVIGPTSTSTSTSGSDAASVAAWDLGQSTLSFRISNVRGNQLVNAEIRVAMLRTELEGNGKPFYRMLELTLTRPRAMSLSRSWTVLHTIDPASPLWGETAESLATKEVELHVMVIGLDDIFMQTVHAAHRYMARQILWGHRHADVLSELPNGDLLLDLRRFHDVEAIPGRPDAPVDRPGDHD